MQTVSLKCLFVVSPVNIVLSAQHSAASSPLASELLLLSGNSLEMPPSFNQTKIYEIEKSR